MKPILFNTEMVRAILEGRKTTTRRIVKPKCKWNFIGTNFQGLPMECRMIDIETQEIIRQPKSPYQSGDILYVRETWRKHSCSPEFGYIYKANYVGTVTETAVNWKPSIHMPKEAARIFLRVTDVRAERLQDIECIATEGVTMVPADDKRDPRYYFTKLWDSTVKKSDLPLYGWAANPWVWVIKFERTARPDEE